MIQSLQFLKHPERYIILLKGVKLQRKKSERKSALPQLKSHVKI